MTDLLALVDDTVAADLPVLIGDLEAARAKAWAKLTAATTAKTAADTARNDDNQTAEVIAAALNVPMSFIYELGRQDRIPVERFGRYRRFSLAAVRAALAAEANSKRAGLGINRKPKCGNGSKVPATDHQPSPKVQR